MRFFVSVAALAGLAAAQINEVGPPQTQPVEPTALQDPPTSIPEVTFVSPTGGPYETPSISVSDLPSDITIITGTRTPSGSSSMGMGSSSGSSMMTSVMSGSSAMPTKSTESGSGSMSSSAGGGAGETSMSMSPTDAAGAAPTANAVAGLVALAGFAMAL
ncbi:hypothetical protein K4F52_001092 [Lecanicillium sp. MT-2017a]|nr:hypothetical protein K4F52_001092 [Lecanicillium sp. MT-2017a]